MKDYVRRHCRLVPAPDNVPSDCRCVCSAFRNRNSRARPIPMTGHPVKAGTPWQPGRCHQSGRPDQPIVLTWCMMPASVPRWDPTGTAYLRPSRGILPSHNPPLDSSAGSVHGKTPGKSVEWAAICRWDDAFHQGGPSPQGSPPATPKYRWH